LECFYGHCGYIPYWNRTTDNVPPPLPLDKTVNRRVAVSQYFETVLRHGTGILSKDLFYLEGRLSGYKESHPHVHNMTIAGVGAGMSKYERVATLGERRKKVYRRVFKHMTGHEDYESAQNDIRMMTPTGIVSEEPAEESSDLPEDFSEVYVVAEIGSGETTV
jgi:hypothetical protein